MALPTCPRRLQIKPSFHLSSSSRERGSAKGLISKTENVNGTASNNHSAGLGIQLEIKKTFKNN
jgi:hypothetical protein